MAVMTIISTVKVLVRAPDIPGRQKEVGGRKAEGDVYQIDREGVTFLSVPVREGGFITAV